MDNTSDEIKGGFEYNTGRRALKLPEYGRNVQKMVAYLKTIEDRDKRNEQARAVVKVMELLNPQVHLQDNYEQKLWDHLQIIADSNSMWIPLIRSRRRRVWTPGRSLFPSRRDR